MPALQRPDGKRCPVYGVADNTPLTPPGRHRRPLDIAGQTQINSLDQLLEQGNQQLDAQRDTFLQHVDSLRQGP